MRSVIPMKTAKIGYIVISAILCVLGVILVIFPEFSAYLLGINCGITFMVFGIVKLVGYFSRDLYRLAFQYDLAFGILLIAIGFVMATHSGSVINFICITLGISALADALFKIQIAAESKRFGIHKWWLILVCALLTGIFGLVLMLRPSESGRVMTVLLGLTLLAEGVLNFSTVVTAVKIIKHQQPDVIEADYYDERED